MTSNRIAALLSPSEATVVRIYTVRSGGRVIVQTTSQAMAKGAYLQCIELGSPPPIIEVKEVQ